MEYPTIGRIVHFTLDYADQTVGPNNIRPAIVVADFGAGSVNLHVFLDGLNDVGKSINGNVLSPSDVRYGYWVTSATASDKGHGDRGVEPQPGHWHWPKRA